MSFETLVKEGICQNETLDEEAICHFDTLVDGLNCYFETLIEAEICQFDTIIKILIKIKIRYFLLQISNYLRYLLPIVNLSWMGGLSRAEDKQGGWDFDHLLREVNPSLKKRILDLKFEEGFCPG